MATVILSLNNICLYSNSNISKQNYLINVIKKLDKRINIILDCISLVYFSPEVFEFLAGEAIQNREIRFANVHGGVQEFLEMLSYETLFKKISLDLSSKNHKRLKVYIE